MYNYEHFSQLPDRVGGWKNKRRVNFCRLQARGNIGYNGCTCSKTHANIHKVLKKESFSLFCIASIQRFELKYNFKPSCANFS